MTNNILGGKDLPNNSNTLAKFEYYNTKDINIRVNDYFTAVVGDARIINDKSVEYLLIIQKLQEMFLSIFDYTFEDKNYSNREKRDFVVKLEKTLFLNGRCAIVKWGKKIYPLPFHYEEQDIDLYGNPLKIKVDLSLSKKSTDNKDIKKLIFSNEGDEKQFVIVNNNSLKLRTLFNMQERILELCKRIIELDNAAFISKPHLFWISEADDESVRDINLALNDDHNLVKKIPDEFKEALYPFIGPDLTSPRQEQVLFYLNFVFKLAGFSVNDLNNKKERQTEEEIKKSDTFTGLLKNMLIEREVAFADVRDILNVNINVKADTDFIITEQEKEQNYYDRTNSEIVRKRNEK